MKRSLSIAALATLAAGSALAQSSNVVIYGRFNDSVERQKVGSTSVYRVQDASSRLGFKGTENLGNNLKAFFTIEHGFGADTGAQAAAAPRFWNRESTVGIGHANFGAIRLGNMPASEAYYATADYVGLHNHDTGTSQDYLWGGVAVGLLQNAVAYTSPTFSGLRFDAQYSLSESAPAATTPRSFALNFDRGPLHLGAGYETDTTDRESLTLRALYEMGAFTFGGYYERDSGTAAYKRNSYRVVGMYRLGQGEFHANVGIAGNRGGVADSGARQLTLAYNYNLSKRTKVYTFYTKIDNKSAANYGFAGAAGQDRQSIAAGIRHNF